eukprot:TRINITY_DN2055_c0_g2_i1.p1 TRINITY_DN2055_c0_g2~~TRINITY_DN2055_c0_g2_i1.p1  ORF type:complete len:426 (-),score=83.42 TRINITY_DN2055_c0_g2_i1:592-1869(-)
MSNKSVSERLCKYECAMDKIVVLSETIDEDIATAFARYTEQLTSIETRLLEMLSLRIGANQKALSHNEWQCIALQRHHRQTLTTHAKRISPHCMMSLTRSVSPLSTYSSLHQSGVCVQLRIPREICMDGALSERIPTNWLSFGYPEIMRDPKTIGSVRQSVGKREGTQPLSFYFPRTIAVHPVTREIYVAEEDHMRVQILKPTLEFSGFLPIGASKASKTEATQAWCVCISNTGERIAVVRFNRFVDLYDGQNQHLTTITSRPKDKFAFRNPRNATFDLESKLYVSDHEANCIFVFSCDGDFLCKFATNQPPLCFEKPYGITTSFDGHLLVLAQGADRVHVLSTDGAHVGSFPIKRVHETWSNVIQRGPRRGFVVSNYGNNSVQFYDESGDMLHDLPFPDTLGVCFGPDDLFYTVSCKDHCVKIF